MNDLSRREAKRRLEQLETHLSELQPLLNTQQNAAALAVLCDLRGQLDALFLDLLSEHLSEQMATKNCAVESPDKDELAAELRALLASFLG